MNFMKICFQSLLENLVSQLLVLIESFVKLQGSTDPSDRQKKNTFTFRSCEAILTILRKLPFECAIFI